MGNLGEFPFSTPLAHASDTGAAAWTFLTADAADPVKGWNTVGFDDKAWKTVNAPLQKPGRTKPLPPNKVWDKPQLLMRRTFTAKTTDFDALRIKARTGDMADIYLNGRHVTRILPDRRGASKYIDFDVTSAALPALKKGRNVLAVKAVRDGGNIDLGLLGIKR